MLVYNNYHHPTNSFYFPFWYLCWSLLVSSNVGYISVLNAHSDNFNSSHCKQFISQFFFLMMFTHFDFCLLAVNQPPQVPLWRREDIFVRSWVWYLCYFLWNLILRYLGCCFSCKTWACWRILWIYSTFGIMYGKLCFLFLKPFWPELS